MLRGRKLPCLVWPQRCTSGWETLKVNIAVLFTQTSAWSSFMNQQVKLWNVWNKNHCHWPELLIWRNNIEAEIWNVSVNMLTERVFTEEYELQGKGKRRSASSTAASISITLLSHWFKMTSVVDNHNSRGHYFLLPHLLFFNGWLRYTKSVQLRLPLLPKRTSKASFPLWLRDWCGNTCHRFTSHFSISRQPGELRNTTEQTLTHTLFAHIAPPKRHTVIRWLFDLMVIRKMLVYHQMSLKCFCFVLFCVGADF